MALTLHHCQDLMTRHILILCWPDGLWESPFIVFSRLQLVQSRGSLTGYAFG